MKNIKYTALGIFIVVCCAMVSIGCGDDSVSNNNNNGGGTAPTLNMKTGSIYAFTVDSLDTNGSTRNTGVKTYQSFIAQGTYFGQSNAFAIRTETKDTAHGNVTLGLDTMYVRYDGGKFYQYGVIQLLDPNQSPTWDLVADFTVSQGTQWTIASGLPITINGIGATANIKGKVAANETFTTNTTNKNINSYRIEITAEITALSVVVGTITVDYYIGYADPTTNPSGMVRLKLRPIWLSAFGNTLYRAAGADQKIQYYIIP